MPISTTDDYERALSVVRAVISDWDPYKLLQLGAPTDEFDSEVAEIVSRSRQMVTPDDAALTISQVFSKAFDAHDFSPASCSEIGLRLFRALTDADLLPTRGSAP